MSNARTFKTANEVVERLKDYGFTDEYGHKLETCVEFFALANMLTTVDDIDKRNDSRRIKCYQVEIYNGDLQSVKGFSKSKCLDAENGFFLIDTEEDGISLLAIRVSDCTHYKASPIYEMAVR
ncbi:MULTISPECIES: hypothetical protein [Yersinia pseudotuberculosis complex]|uniref:Uncharacterized protein n=1 Tax=Yersinia similis TaxID=367190 RepID=A0A0T9QKE9_9GAMM|nr:hypothetical protein [Yersinia similis]BET63258.1 hypothetical protein YPSE1_27170 [Yersinia pseudotuberculosis]BET64866.1 hypothetical protein YPSE1_43250 [Yersinia pseudotuberculosis]CNI16242.1 Uncharacterised protein [Yersinia similis]